MSSSKLSKDDMCRRCARAGRPPIAAAACDVPTTARFYTIKPSTDFYTEPPLYLVELQHVDNPMPPN
ncbi:hypothetical protein AMJ71_11045 [candidate division TA06 bacterium SM1_40]|uniref:Uncharacterized protein n=1 Tax=candidate division TA06 bacterium SM1_40 TaxID=1703773 RepID=A0A0S8J8W4_UNCT6|nr:MAG: hypothetical protein AMJ71_11045 [candidate division TA06 bacterium SM1_40]